MKIKSSERMGHVTFEVEDVFGEYATFRRGLRQLLFEYGIKSNPCWTDNDIVRAFQAVLSKDKKMIRAINKGES